MGTPNEELIQRISSEFLKKGLAKPEEIKKLAEKMAAGKVKAEDWYAIFENSLEVTTPGGKDGN